MANTNTSLPALEAALGAVPATFRSRLVSAYADLKSAYANRQFDACGLRAGKFCEVLLRYLQHELTGSYIPFGTKIPNFTDECRSLERLPKATGLESLRVLIPRALDFVYTLRNKRDIGHIGGDVDVNEIDAVTAVRGVDWCLSELIRIVHNLSLEEAQALLDAIAERQIPIVWAVGGVKRVLEPQLTKSEQTLLLLYSDPDSAVPAEDLCRWVEVARMANFRERVLLPLHRQRLIDYDAGTETVSLSPKGAARAEEVLAKATARAGS
jgi:hypothetical protein